MTDTVIVHRSTNKSVVYVQILLHKMGLPVPLYLVENSFKSFVKEIIGFDLPCYVRCAAGHLQAGNCLKEKPFFYIVQT